METLPRSSYPSRSTTDTAAPVQDRAVAVRLGLGRACGDNGGVGAGDDQVARTHLHAEMLGVDDGIVDRDRAGTGK